MSVGSAAGPPAARARTGRVLTAATVGIFIEAFDWTVYGLVAPNLAVELFPGSSHTHQLLGAYVVFAGGFLARPFGSAVMGRITDTRGRRTGLMASVALIALGSLVLVVTPTFAQVGYLAPLIVLGARVLQGIAMGGEIATAATYVVEVAPRRRRHLFGSIAYSGDGFGSLAASLVFAAVTAAVGASGMDSGGWRLMFLVGALLGLAAFWIRRGAPESPVFTAAAAGPNKPVGPLLRAHAGRMVLVLFMTIGSTVGVYFGTVYLPQFASHGGHISQTEATSQLAVPSLVLVVAMVSAGLLADRVGPLALIRTGFTGLALLTPVVMPLMLDGRMPFVVAGSVFCLFLGLQLGVTPIAGARLFPVPIRAVALGVPAGIAIAVFGGTLPFVGEFLSSHGHLGLVVAYVTLAAAGSAVGSWLLRESLLYPDTPTAPEAAGADAR